MNRITGGFLKNEDEETSRTADGRHYECIHARPAAVALLPRPTTSSADAADTSASAESDVDYVKSNGKLVIGITDFAPMDYKEDGSDEWVGFDADMAKAFAESLGVKAEFIEINWDNKIMELDGKGVDAVWNGMTLTDEVKTSMNCSDPYATNAQVVVVPSDKADAAKDHGRPSRGCPSLLRPVPPALLPHEAARSDRYRGSVSG